jgi:hypothetical protein
MISPDDRYLRGRLFIHELHHRVQPQLGQMIGGASNDHLDTLEGRYWLRLEWRALAAALGSSGPARAAAIGDALAFRASRYALFAQAAESEHADEIREDLASYTGTVVASASATDAVADAITQLNEAHRMPTFVRTFAYPSGAAYGVLLDTYAPGWTRRLRPATEDLGTLLLQASGSRPAGDAQASAARYGSGELRTEEERRDAEQARRVAELRQRFVDGPILIVPRGKGAMLNTTGATPIPGTGTVLFEYRVTAPWGTLESRGGILEAADGLSLRLPLPYRAEETTLVGDGWQITLAEGWIVRPGTRAGDFELSPAPR